MNNYKNTLLLATALAVVLSSIAQAGTLTVINKLPKERIQLCIRGEGTQGRADKDCFLQCVEACAQAMYTVTKVNVQGENTFEVIASTDNGGDPDWKLLGATCSNLVTDADHTIIIDSTLGKLSCQDVTAANPQAR